MLTRFRSLPARLLPWWAVLVLGIGCAALGVVLTLSPFHSLSVLALLVGIGLLATGVLEIGTAAASSRPSLSYVAGVVWMILGIVALAWPGITILTLAVLVGIGLVIGGAATVAVALFGSGDERFIVGLSGLTNIIVGVIALSWPAVTVLVLAIVFGIRTIIFGISQVAIALKLRRDPTGATLIGSGQTRWPRVVRLAGAIIVFALALGGMAISIAINRSQPNEPGPFYTAPEPLPEGPMGTIIRKEVVDDFYPGTTTYRVLYLSTGYDGNPTAVSGLVVIPDTPVPDGGRKVVAYTHGTVGVAPRCSPSLQGKDWAQFIEGLPEFVAVGYVIAATDYQGMGTPGPHPYLVGPSEAMNEIDNVRAAISMPETQAGNEYAVWGHSQGGHASLFTGQTTAGYAPELDLVGVAAGAPVPDLLELFKFNVTTTVGKILISMALDMWAKVYDDAELDQIVVPAARPAVREIARNCLYSKPQILASLPSSLALDIAFLSNPPWETEPWKMIAETNTPGNAPTGVPILITQGTADEIVAPSATEQLADKLCANGEVVELRLLDGIGHVAGGFDAAPHVAEWIGDRFAGDEATSSCP